MAKWKSREIKYLEIQLSKSSEDLIRLNINLTAKVYKRSAAWQGGDFQELATFPSA